MLHAEAYIVLCISIDFAVLSVVGTILNRRAKQRLFFFISFLTSTATLLAIVLTVPFVLPVIYVLFCLAVCHWCFGVRGVKERLIYTVTHLGVSIFIHGAAQWMIQSLSRGGSEPPGSAAQSIVALSAAVFLVSKLVTMTRNRFRLDQVKGVFQYTVTIELEERKWSGKAFLDSGNAVTDPFSGQPVIFLAAGVASVLLESEQLPDCETMIRRLPAALQKRIRLIPLGTVHAGSSVMYAVRSDRVMISMSDKSTFSCEDIPIVFTEKAHFISSEYACLLHPYLFQQQPQKGEMVDDSYGKTIGTTVGRSGIQSLGS